MIDFGKKYLMTLYKDYNFEPNGEEVKSIDGNNLDIGATG